MFNLNLTSIKQHWAKSLWFVLLLGFLGNILYLLWPSTPASIVLHSSPAIANLFIPSDTGELSDEALATLSTSTNHRSKHASQSTKKVLQKVHLNSASAQDLQHLPGVGVKIAGRIVAYRKQIGKFTSADQLTNVSGIGVKKLTKMRPYCIID